MTTRGFVNKYQIRAAVEWTEQNKNAPEWTDANHFKVTLRRGRKRLTTYFSQGYGINGEPDVAKVLDCLASEAASVENETTFEDFCREFGYDTDSRKAERIYKTCQREAAKLKRFLGEELYNQLLWHTERL